MSEVQIKDRPRWWAVYKGYPALRLITNANSEDEIPTKFFNDPLIWILEDDRTDTHPAHYLSVLAQAASVGLDPAWVDRQLVWLRTGDDTSIRAACARYGFQAKHVGGVWEIRHKDEPGKLGRGKTCWSAWVHFYKQLD